MTMPSFENINPASQSINPASYWTEPSTNQTRFNASDIWATGQYTDRDCAY